MSADFYILFDRIDIQAANTISSPLTYGFPAITGFLGAIHALQRRLPADFPLTLGGVLIASHRCMPQVYQAEPYSDMTFIQSRNPLKKDGGTAAIIEEGKVHLTVSLVVEASGHHDKVLKAQEALEKALHDRLMQGRIAGGSVTHIGHVRLYEAHQTDLIKSALLPAYVLLDAGDAVTQIVAELQSGYKVTANRRGRIRQTDEPTGYPAQPEIGALDALLATAQFFHIPPKEKEKDWQHYSIRSGRGWLVPIPVGYQAISPLYDAAVMQHSRNPEYPAQYVETLYSLGKWVFPHRLPDRLETCFWHYSHPQENLYLVSQTR